jgi:catechol 2,3-dioxygenase-like lactoylglutathione lyase family enzyme
MAETSAEPRTTSHLSPKMLSHGTVETHDLDAAKLFYSDFLGMDVVQTSAISLMLRLNSITTIAAVQTKGATSAGIYSHFGFDYETKEEVDAAYETAVAQKDHYKIQKITRPVDQHGTYSFYIIDFDGNWWEILTNPDGGYSYVFDIEEESRSWRDLDRGKDRISKAGTKA